MHFARLALPLDPALAGPRCASVIPAAETREHGGGAQAAAEGRVRDGGRVSGPGLAGGERAGQAAAPVNMHVGWNGTRYKGRHKEGTRYNGRHKEGTRYNGRHKKGTRYNGRHKEGTRYNGRHKEGTRTRRGTRRNEKPATKRQGEHTGTHSKGNPQGRIRAAAVRRGWRRVPVREGRRGSLACARGSAGEAIAPGAGRTAGLLEGLGAVLVACDDLAHEVYGGHESLAGDGAGPVTPHTSRTFLSLPQSLSLSLCLSLSLSLSLSLPLSLSLSLSL